MSWLELRAMIDVWAIGLYTGFLLVVLGVGVVCWLHDRWDDWRRKGGAK